MKPFPTFDPGQMSGTLETQGVNKNEQLMMYNDSLYGLLLMFPDNSIDIIPPSWNKSFIIQSAPMGKVQWSVYNQVPLNNYPMSQVYGVLYENGEHVPQVNAGMQRGFNVTGGSVTTSGNSVVNDGNTAGTSILESTVSGQSGSSVQLKNDGTGTISVIIASALVQIVKLSTVDPVLALGALARMVEILGDIKVDGTTFLGNLQLFGNIVLPYPSVQTLSNNSTINLNVGSLVVITNSATLTGIIMSAGTTVGQLIYLYNSGSSPITFAATGSRVKNGVNITIGNGQTAVMLWDGSNWSTAYK